MEIFINHPHVETDVSAAEGRTRDALERFAERLTRVDVFMKDLNGEKGGVDKRCTVTARPRGLDPVAVEEDATDFSAALTGALAKMKARLDTQFGRLADH